MPARPLTAGGHGLRPLSGPELPARSPTAATFAVVPPPPTVASSSLPPGVVELGAGETVLDAPPSPVEGEWAEDGSSARPFSRSRTFIAVRPMPPPAAATAARDTRVRRRERLARCGALVVVTAVSTGARARVPDAPGVSSDTARPTA
ncbi:hypothetical protein ABZ931_38855, partial [Streptomyces neyagawaensis]